MAATIRNGSKGSDVKTLQKFLMDNGYDVGSTGADGIFGSKTQAAVKQYQKDNGLTVDGIVGKNTWASINSASNSSKNNNNAPTTKLINGVEDQALQDKAFNNTFNESDYADIMEQKDKLNTSITNLEKLTSVEDIIDPSTMAALNERFQVSDAYNQAMAYTNQLLEQLSTGRTSYTDQIKDMMNKIQNRDEFEYDVDNDQLFQQALASAMNSGKSAMQDTIGQASSLTGGYGSTYATSAGNQAYNSFIEDAYNNLPEYYQMAMEAYQMEGQEMYNQLGMLQAADESEWNKLYSSWDANFKNAQNIWNQDFSTWEAGVSQAYNSAQLQLSEHNTLVDDAYKMYSANMDMYESMYSKAWDNWDSEVKQAQAAVSAYQTDYWSQKDLDYKYDTLEETKRQFDKEFSANYTSDGNGGYVAKDKNGSSSSFKLSDTEISKCKEIIANGGSRDDVLDYLNAKGNLPQTDEDDATLDTILGIGGGNGGTTSGSVKTGDVSNFRVTEGDNFDVNVNGTNCRVENHGKVTDEATVNKLNKLGVANNKAFVYNGEGYVKYGDGFYKIGATNILFWKTNGYSDLLGGLSQ